MEISIKDRNFNQKSKF